MMTFWCENERRVPNTLFCKDHDDWNYFRLIGEINCCLSLFVVVWFYSVHYNKFQRFTKDRY